MWGRGHCRSNSLVNLGHLKSGQMTHSVATCLPSENFYNILNTGLLQIELMEGKLGKRWHAASLQYRVLSPTKKRGGADCGPVLTPGSQFL